MADDSGIDPRYAAQFQRGYDPQQHASTSGAADSAATRDAPVRLPGGPLPTAARIPDGPRARPAVVPAPREIPESPDQFAQEERASRPRLEWAVLATGAVLIVVSIVTLWSYVEKASAPGGIGPAADAQVLSILVVVFVGPAFLAGVIGVIAWMVLRALAARSRP